jgi:hypothetical protein
MKELGHDCSPGRGLIRNSPVSATAAQPHFRENKGSITVKVIDDIDHLQVMV